MEHRSSREAIEAAVGQYGPSDSYKRGYRYITSVATTGITGTMNVYDFVVEMNIVAANYTLTLPAVHEARGKIYTIQVMDADTKTLTVTDAGDDPRWSDQSLGDDNDYLVLFSNGKRWFILVSQTD